jgi:uroporphyrinogen-III synthase
VWLDSVGEVVMNAATVAEAAAGRFDWIVFTSAAGVRIGLPGLVRVAPYEGA